MKKIISFLAILIYLKSAYGQVSVFLNENNDILVNPAIQTFTILKSKDSLFKREYSKTNYKIVRTDSTIEVQSEIQVFKPTGGNRRFENYIFDKDLNLKKTERLDSAQKLESLVFWKLVNDTLYSFRKDFSEGFGGTFRMNENLVDLKRVMFSKKPKFYNESYWWSKWQNNNIPERISKYALSYSTDKIGFSQLFIKNNGDTLLVDYFFNKGFQLVSKVYVEYHNDSVKDKREFNTTEVKYDRYGNILRIEYVNYPSINIRPDIVYKNSNVITYKVDKSGLWIDKIEKDSYSGTTYFKRFYE